MSDYESSLRNIFTKAIKINQSDLSGRKNIKIKPSKHGTSGVHFEKMTPRSTQTC